MSQLTFTLSDMLLFIICALLIGACFGGWIVRESRALWKRPTMGELMARLSQIRGEQVMRSQGLSICRSEDFEEEGRLAHDYETEEKSDL